MNCYVPVYLAYIVLAYVLASCLYLKRTASMGTKFRDSLQPHQLKIKKEVSKIRKDIFISSFLICFIIVIILKPFKKCM